MSIFNPDTDCSICFQLMEEKLNGDNCQHPLCQTCFNIILDSTNKCPICRLKLDNSREENSISDEDEYEYDGLFDPNVIISQIDFDNIIPGSKEVIFEGSDNYPIDNLFNGRRWFDSSLNEIKIYQNNNFLTEMEYRNTIEHFISERELACRILSLHANSFDINKNCPCCGIQRTKNANKYLIKNYIYNYPDDTSNYTISSEGIYIYDYHWGTNAFDGNGSHYCLMCWIILDNIMQEMPYY
jgi:hypothetical protein